MYLAIDIDDTLCNTTLRWMCLFQEQFGNPEGLSPEQLVEKYEIVQYVPYRQTPQANNLIQQLVQDDKNWLNLPVIPQAQQAIQTLRNHFPLLYLTGRTEEHRAKTLLRLEQNNFPLYELRMRPNTTQAFTQAEGQFERKAQYLIETYPDISGIIDNSASLARQLYKLKYPGTHILFGHTPQKHTPATYQLQTRAETQELIELLTLK